jgi:hypothetical protein
MRQPRRLDVDIVVGDPVVDVSEDAGPHEAKDRRIQSTEPVESGSCPRSGTSLRSGFVGRAELGSK